MANSIISCKTECLSIFNAMEQALHMECGNYINPYGDGNTSGKISKIIKEYLIGGNMDLKKNFYDLV